MLAGPSVILLSASLTFTNKKCGSMLRILSMQVEVQHSIGQGPVIYLQWDPPPMNVRDRGGTSSHVSSFESGMPHNLSAPV